MTISEMHIAVKLGLDKSSALELPAFEPEEIDFWLNKAILQFVKIRYTGSNIKRESFEQTQKRIDDLRTIIEETQITNPGIGTSSDKPNVYLIDLLMVVPDYMFRVGEEVEISFTDSVTNSEIIKRQSVTECTADTYNTYIDNPFSEHILYLKEAKPLRLFRGDYVELITDGNYEITKYFLRYIRRPAEVSITSSPNVNCDLPDHTHHEIVDMTVGMLLENIESNRLQNFKNEALMSE